METKPRAVALISHHPELKEMSEKMQARRNTVIAKIKFFQKSLDAEQKQLREEELKDWLIIEGILFEKMLLKPYDKEKFSLDMSVDQDLLCLKSNEEEIPEFIKKLLR